MKKFALTALALILVILLVGGFSLTAFSLALAVTMQGHGEIVSSALADQTGSVIITDRPDWDNSEFYPEMTPQFSDSSKPHYMPVFTFKLPEKKHEFKQLIVMLRLTQAREVSLSPYAGNSWDINVAHVYVQRLVVNPEMWPGPGVKSAPLGYHPLGIQIKLTCANGYCVGSVPDVVLSQLLKDTQPGEEFSLRVVGYDLDSALRAPDQWLIFDDPEKPGSSQATFYW